MKVESIVKDAAGDTRYELSGGYYGFDNGDIFTPKGKPVKPESFRYKRLQVSINIYKALNNKEEK